MNVKAIIHNSLLISKYINDHLPIFNNICNLISYVIYLCLVKKPRKEKCRQGLNIWRNLVSQRKESTAQYAVHSLVTHSIMKPSFSHKKHSANSNLYLEKHLQLSSIVLKCFQLF